MTTDQKGAIAEAKIIAAAVELGIPVLKPFNDGLRYDLVFDLGSLVRVQCKWIVRRRNALLVPFRTSRRGPDGFVRRPYTADEVDLIASYCAELDRCYLLPLAEFDRSTTVSLRISPAANNQRARIHWAREFEFAATLERHFGAVAQLGERRAGSA